MKKALLLTLLLLLPSAVWAQVALRASSIAGNVEWRAVNGKAFRSLTTSQPVQVGDEIRTGPDAQLILQVPDGSYMVVLENSKLVVEHLWSGQPRTLMYPMSRPVRVHNQPSRC